MDRGALAALRAELGAETERLKAELARIRRTHDVSTLKELSAALQRHHERLRHYHDALDIFHTKHGPVGE